MSSVINVDENQLYEAHLSGLRDHWDSTLERHGFDGAWICAGDQDMYLFDDHGPQFKPNPHLAQWFAPNAIPPGTLLWLSPGQIPTLLLEQSEDYWHAKPQPPQGIDAQVNLVSFDSIEALTSGAAEFAKGAKRVAVIWSSVGG